VPDARLDRLKVKPGDTVVVKDGTYGLRIVCGSENPALKGGSATREANARWCTRPITVRARMSARRG
jgi:hypothetical protein